MASSVKYYRDDAALTILGNLTEQNSENTQTLADVSVRLSTLEDSSTSTISVMGSANSYAAGLVLAGDATHGSEFLRKDGTWQIPTDTNTIYSIMGASSRADGAGQYAAGLVLAGQSNGTRFLKEDGQWAAPGGGGGTTVSGTSLKSNNTNTNVNTTGGISLGSSTGNSGQGDYAVAIGYQAG